MTILDGIRLISEAWDLVPESALEGIWNKPLIQRKQQNDFKPELTGTINDIVQMGQSLGIDNIDATTVTELLKPNTDSLSNEELIELDNE